MSNQPSSPIMHATDLCKYYPIKKSGINNYVDLKALDGVSLELKAGETLAVVGESGCGKSTLARMLTQIEKPTSGELVVDGIDVVNANKQEREELRRRVQIVFQDPYGSLNPRKKIGSILEEPMIINTKRTATDRKDRAIDMLQRVGLRAEHYHRYPHMFSGGQRQRIAIARALMLEPKIIIADEPVSALDVSIQAQVLNLFMDLQEEFNLAYVFISHGLSVVEHISNDVNVMYLGRIVESADKKTLFSSPAHPYTQALLASTPFVDPTKRAKRVKLDGELPSPLNVPSGCPFHKRCPIAVERCRVELPLLRQVNNQMVACHEAK